MLNKFSPVWVDGDGLASCDNEQEMLGSCQRNVHPPNITQETDPVATRRSNRGENDDVSLTPLKRINRIHFYKLVEVIPKGFEKSAFEEC